MRHHGCRGSAPMRKMGMLGSAEPVNCGAPSTSENVGGKIGVCVIIRPATVISTTEHAALSANRESNPSENHVATQSIIPTSPGVIDFCSGLGGLSLAAKNIGL